MDIRVGGAWRFVDKRQPGFEQGFMGEFKEVAEPNKLVHTFEYEPMPGHLMLESVTFERLSEGKTKATTLSKYETLDDLNGIVSSGMERGADAGIERLAKLVKGE